MKQWFLSLLIPPKPGSAEDDLYVWRIAMSFSVSAVALVLAAHMAWTVGWPPFDENDGFVGKDQFAMLAADVRSARKNALKTSIFTTFREECLSEPNSPYQRLLEQQFLDLKEEWRELTGAPFPNLECRQIR